MNSLGKVTGYRHGGRSRVQVSGYRRTVGIGRTVVAAVDAEPQRRPSAGGQPRVSDRHFVRPQDRHPVGGFPPGTGLLRHDLVESPARLDAGRGVGETAPVAAGQTPRRRPNRLLASDRGLLLRACRARGEKTGPSPVDRRKSGSKHHLVVDAGGVPLAAILTSANRHDVTQLLPLIEAIPPIGGKVGAPLRTPKEVMGDRAYDSDPHRMRLSARGITTAIARRREAHGSGLGIYRYVVEQTLALFHQFRRLRTRFDKRDDIHEAFMTLGCAMICWRRFHCLTG